ncbi:MAG: exosortase system-associated protein, TIGR04073 family [Candidatus Omnitrophota bacterium]
MAGLLVFGVGSIGYAAEEGAEHQATPATKLGNGLGNALTGWMEIPRKISEVSSEQDAFAGITIGTLTGAAYGTGRTAAGVLDTATFVVPPYDKPIMEPNYSF